VIVAEVLCADGGVIWWSGVDPSAERAKHSNQVGHRPMKGAIL
jgi:hypothetical protein